MTAARVAFIDHAPFVGGAETVLLDLIAHLDRAQFDPIAAVPGDSPLVPLLDARRMPWCNLPMPRLHASSPLTPLRWLSASNRLARIVRERQIQLVHANTVRAHLVSAFARGAPVVWMLHDDTFPRRLFAWLRRRPAALIANSHATARFYGIEGDPRAFVVHNGIDTQAPRGDDAAFRRRLGIDARELVIAHVGRLARWKGQDVFLRAAAQVAPRFPQARFVLVGTYAAGDESRGELGGGASYEAELRQPAQAAGLGDRVVFAGHQSDMAGVYASIDLLVHSSTRPEPFGRVLIEAMSAGVPVIAAALGGPLEIVEDGVTGRLVEPNRVDQLSAAMESVLADAPARAAMGLAARQRARERFDIRRQAAAVESIYRAILNR